MNSKPSSRSEYDSQLPNLVHSICLYISTILGDFFDDYVVVGGLVPALIIPQYPPPGEADRHVGTRDLDLGFSLAIFEENLYQAIASRLRGAGFVPDHSEEGNPTLQRWRLEEDIGVTIDFLVPQSSPDDRGGSIKHMEQDFGAIVTPGLELAFQDRLSVTLSGKTPMDESAERDIGVCGPGAYVVLKALAFGSRGDNKDAYDLYYVIRNYGRGPEQVAEHLAPLLDNPFTQDAIRILRRDFVNPEYVGPARVARFLFGEPNDETQADVAGFINQFLTLANM